MPPVKTAYEIFNTHARLYEQKFMDQSLYHDALDAFCNAVEKPGASVLELACGPGNITRYLLQQRPDFRLLGTDIAPNMIERAKANNPTAEFILMDCRDMALLKRQFDALVCGFCLPYLSEEESRKLFADCAALLHPGAPLYVSTMEADETHVSGLVAGSHNDSTYVYYHTAAFVSDALEAAGFEITRTDRKTYRDGGKTTTDLVIIAQKRIE